MSDDIIREHKLVEAIPESQRNVGGPALGGKPEQTHANSAEQQREAQESQEARNAQGGVKDRLVDIGKAGHMGGRGGHRVSDS